ncbi:MAG: hypothetical protein WC862_02570 [Patescibacteria group bacterium]
MPHQERVATLPAVRKKTGKASWTIGGVKEKLLEKSKEEFANLTTG